MSDINMCSLEDEECNELFITQEPKENLCEIIENEGEEEYGSILGIDGQDFGSPNVSVVRGLDAVYSDISDTEEFVTDTKVKSNDGANGSDGCDGKGGGKSKQFGQGLTRMIGLHSRKWYGSQKKVGLGKAVSRKFHSISNAKLQQLKTKTIKKRSFHKMQWAVKAYKEWRNVKLSDIINFNYRIYEANLDKVESLDPSHFEFVMCRFIPEVRKVNGDDYPGATLYQMCVAIQKYINENGKNWKIVEGDGFSQLRVVLDNVMKERALMNLGAVKKQANVISYDFENQLWKKGILGEDTPDKLRGTVLFLLGINLGLRAGDEHYYLRRCSSDRDSQISFECSDKGVRCLVYREDHVTKTNDGGLKHFRKEKKVVWVYPSSDINRCPVRLVEKYMGLCPSVVEGSGKANLYLRSLVHPTPIQWYSSRVLGINAIKQVVTTMLKDAKLDGYFTNHSLRRSGTTRLFQADIDRKLVKEYTGHSSDAVDKYQVTSHEQRERLSNIISKGVDPKECNSAVNDCQENSIESHKDAGHVECETRKKVEKDKSKCNSIEISLNNVSPKSNIGCTCTRQNVNLAETNNIGKMLNDMLASKMYEKATIKIEIQLKQ